MVRISQVVIASVLTAAVASTAHGQTGRRVGGSGVDQVVTGAFEEHPPEQVGGAPLSAARVAGTTSASSSSSTGCRAVWLTPVAADIVDPFRPPDQEYGAGNRGVEFGTRGGEPVVAVDQGLVSFAGPVGGERFVVVSHPNGVKSTYGYLDGIEVAAGVTVDREQRVGYASVGFHLTAREEGRYFDPQPLFERCGHVVRLVPLERDSND